jgi:hypothetical protein
MRITIIFFFGRLNSYFHEENGMSKSDMFASAAVVDVLDEVIANIPPGRIVLRGKTAPDTFDLSMRTGGNDGRPVI